MQVTVTAVINVSIIKKKTSPTRKGYFMYSLSRYKKWPLNVLNQCFSTKYLMVFNLYGELRYINSEIKKHCLVVKIRHITYWTS